MGIGEEYGRTEKKEIIYFIWRIERSVRKFRLFKAVDTSATMEKE